MPDVFIIFPSPRLATPQSRTFACMSVPTCTYLLDSRLGSTPGSSGLCAVVLPSVCRFHIAQAAGAET